MTTFKQIPSYPNYQVNQKGEVKGPSGYIKTQYTNPKGYKFVEIHTKGRVKKRFVHKLVLEAFVGTCPPDHVTRHLNGIPSDNNLSNLKWGTRSENEQDKKKHGTCQYGSKNPNSKLTEEDVLNIRDYFTIPGITKRMIRKLYNMSKEQIKSIKNRRTWKHI